MNSLPIRVVPTEELPLDDTHTRGVITFTVSSALKMRRATNLVVLEDERTGQAIASAVTPHGRLEALGRNVADAVGRLSTLATRPQGRE
jgi:hypothetical protein